MSTGLTATQNANRVIDWRSDEEFVIGDTTFVTTVDLKVMHAIETTNKRFLLAKNRPLIEGVLTSSETDKPKNIVEIGIFKGGSIALYALLLAPTKLVGLEYQKERVEPLDAFVQAKGLEESVRLYYGVDQGDRPTVSKIIEAEFGRTPLDLVIDDGSHNYEKTKSSFETLFPLLRPGGVFIVEDWAWAHWPGRVWQECEAFPSTLPSVTNLLLEICMLSASRQDLVSQVTVESSLFRVTRGAGQVESGFSLGKHYLNRGKPFVPVM